MRKTLIFLFSFLLITSIAYAETFENTHSIIGIGDIRYLKLNQVSPQTVINGAPNFSAGLITPYLYPSANSTTAFQIRKADGLTNVLNVNTTNGFVSIGTSVTPSGIMLTLENTNADTYLRLQSDAGHYANIWFDYSSADLYIENSYNSDAGNIFFRTKTAATAVNALTILGNGNIGIGQVNPTNMLEMVGATPDIYQDSSASVYHNIDRGATNQFALHRFYTAGALKWTFGMLNDASDNFNIGTTSVAANSALFINRTTGNFTINSATDPNTAKLHIYQGADDKGIRLFGFDDMSANYIDFALSSTGNSTITTSGATRFLSLSSLIFQTSTGTQMSFRAGGKFSFQDVDASNTERVYIDSSTGYIYALSRVVVGSTALAAASVDIGETKSNNLLFRAVNTYTSGASAGAGMIGASDDGAASAVGDRLGFLLFGGAYDTSHDIVNPCGIIGYAAENWSATNQGAYLSFSTTPNGSTYTSRTERLRVNQDGNIYVVADSQKILWGAGQDMSVYYDGTDGNIKTDEVAASDLNITCGTNKTLELQNVVYEDIQFPLASGKVPAANYPTWETFTTNTSAYAFSVDDLIDLQADEAFHKWVEGTAGHLHLHFAIKTAQGTGANRYAKFTIYVALSDATVGSGREVWTEVGPYTAEYTIPTGSLALQGFYLDMGDITLTNYKIGSQIKARIKRIAATGGTEYADDVYITQVGIHLQENTLGSRQETVK